MCRPQNLGPNEPGHGATEAMDENLSQEDGEEPLKKLANDPLIIPVDPVTRDVDNRLLEEQGLMVLTPKDIVLEKNHPGKYEAEQKGKEALDVDGVGARTQQMGLPDNRAISDLDVRGTLTSDLPPAGMGLSAVPLEQKKGGGLGERGAESKGLLDIPDPSAPGMYKSVLQAGTLKATGEGSLPQGSGDGVAGAETNGHPAHLVSSTPRVSHVISGASQQHRGADMPTLHIADDRPRDGAAATSNKPPPHKSVGVLLPQASHTIEAELENGDGGRDEGGHDGYQVSRAVVTFALQEDKTHTIGDDDEGVDENATRAAPFTIASQWQGISALGSSGEEDSDNALDDGVLREGVPRVSRSRSRQLAMNTLADEDDNFDSMARNSLVLLDDRDCLDPLRGSQVFEDDDSHISQLVQACKEEVGGESKVYPPLLSSKFNSPRMKLAAADLPPKPNTSSPRKMPEKLAKDMGNRIGSPLKQGPGSPSKLLFKVRESEEKKGFRPVSKLVATGKPPIHQTVKKDKPLEAPKISTNGSVTTLNSASTKPNEAHVIGTKDAKIASAVGSGSACDKGIVDVHNLTSHSLFKPTLKDKRLEGSGGSDGAKELKSILKVESNVVEVAQGKPTTNGADVAQGRPTTNGTDIAHKDSSPRKLGEIDKGSPPRRASVPTESKIPVSSSRLLAATSSTASEVKRSSPPTKIPVRAGPTKSIDNRKRSVSASRVERSTQGLADIPECVSPLNLDDDSPVPRPPPGPPRSSMSNAR